MTTKKKRFRDNFNVLKSFLFEFKYITNKNLTF